ncbi:hypothetical protein M5X17_27675 [Paenibacillus alvei]|uniref:hypothetical protein n=1 Tax=Paenibacillus alvei TaxID=44250 RepID=UPI0022812CC9|nr:hypothetical protein [Paenibacillus alvei]MCY9737486.1 hypothetical protein [Paenibacillus alvei]
MIEINKMPRGSGKTTRAITLMEYDKNLYCIVPYKGCIDIYPVHLHHRILCGKDALENLILVSKTVSKVILDDGFMYHKDELAKLYYTLGSMKIPTIVYGTLDDKTTLE